MKRQRGSILAGVVGITVGLTAALAAFLVFSGNSNRLEADSESETELHYAAESAMAMGLRWLRAYSQEGSDHLNNSDWPAIPIILNSPANNDTAIAANNYSVLDGAFVKIIFAATHEFEAHNIRCLATLGKGRDTLEIKLYVKPTGSTTEKENGTDLYSLTTSQWRETVHRGH